MFEGSVTLSKNCIYVEHTPDDDATRSTRSKLAELRDVCLNKNLDAIPAFNEIRSYLA